MSASSARGAVEVGGGDGPGVVATESAAMASSRSRRLEPLAEVPAAVPQVLLVGERFRVRAMRSLGGARSPPRARRSRPSAWPSRTARRGSATSPVMRCCTQGTWTAASPQPDDPSMSRPECWRSFVAGMRLGDEVRDRPSGRCSAARSRSHFRLKPLDVVEERGGLDEDLPVAGPSGALAGGAVGRDVAGVAAEAPVARSGGGR